MRSATEEAFDEKSQSGLPAITLREGFLTQRAAEAGTLGATASLGSSSRLDRGSEAKKAQNFSSPKPMVQAKSFSASHLS
jgi:hypothetical protein